MPMEDAQAVRAEAKITEQAALILGGMVRRLVTLPEFVRVDSQPSGTSTLFTLRVAADDVNLVLGPAERTLRSLRTVVMALGRRSGQRFLLDAPSQYD